MQAIRQTLESAQNLQTSNGSSERCELSISTPPRKSLGVSREKLSAMVQVLAKRWLSQGWRVMDEEDSEPMALVCNESLDSERIPFRYYEELYRRSVKLRSRRLAQGLKCDDFSVEMMIACWPSLAGEIREREKAERRFLPANAESTCELCFGSGMRKKINENDPKLSGYVVCDHGNA